MGMFLPGEFVDDGCRAGFLISLFVLVGFVETLCCGVERLFIWFSFPLFLGYSLGFLGCVLCGPCVVHAASWGLRSSEPGGWLWYFWSVFSFFLDETIP